MKSVRIPEGIYTTFCLTFSDHQVVCILIQCTFVLWPVMTYLSPTQNCLSRSTKNPKQQYRSSSFDCLLISLATLSLKLERPEAESKIKKKHAYKKLVLMIFQNIEKNVTWCTVMFQLLLPTKKLKLDVPISLPTKTYFFVNPQSKLA